MSLPNQQYPYGYPYQPQAQTRTAWTDLKMERDSMSEAEINFVRNNKEYQESIVKLNDAFFDFLQQTLGVDFIRSGGQSLVEKALFDLKFAKKEYQKENDGVFNDPEVQALIEQKRRAKNGSRA